MSYNDIIELMTHISIQPVTKEIIDHQRLWLAVLKYAYKMQNEEVRNELHESFMVFINSSCCIY